jgi:E3 ubiquitin-protein ligase BAH
MQARRSKKALQNFLALNTSLIVFNQFNSVNQTAVTKILKKHDKRSGLQYVYNIPIFDS